MLASAIGSYLDTLSEREFDAPFLALLHLKGYTDIHFLHGSFEFGKDFIAKAAVDGVLTQFVFQSKAGNINLGAWNEIRGLIDMLRTTTLAHPNFDSTLPRAARLVITGRLGGAAALAAQSYKDHLIALKEPVLFETWDRDTLLEYLDKTPEALGSSSADLLRLLGTDAFNINQGELERFSRQWMHVQPSVALLRDVLEAAILGSHLLRIQRHDLACFCALNLLRGILATLHGLQSLSQLAEVALETAMKMFSFYADRLWSESVGDFLTPDEMLTKSFPAGFVSYRVRCALQGELLGLYGLYCVERDPSKSKQVADYLSNFFEANVGAAQPISDRYAVSLVPPLLLLWRAGHHSRVKAVLQEATVWIADRYEPPNLGLASATAQVEEEVIFLLGSSFEHVKDPRRRESFVATTILELYIAFSLHKEYEVARNDFSAVDICLPVIEAGDDLAQYALHLQGLRYEANTPFEFDWAGDEDTSPAPHHLVNQTEHYPETYISPWSQLAISSVARNRHFRRAWQKLIATSGPS